MVGMYSSHQIGLVHVFVFSLLFGESVGSYCLRQDANSMNTYPYEYCTSDLRCCPGKGCCALSSTCCYITDAKYSIGCCQSGYSCCSDVNEFRCCKDSTQECCQDALGNAACCLKVEPSPSSDEPLELVYIIAIVGFAMIIAIVAVCAHVRANRQVRSNNLRLHRMQTFSGDSLSPAPRGLNDYDNMDMLPGYKERTPPPTYEEITRITEAIDAAVAQTDGTFLDLRSTVVITNNELEYEVPTTSEHTDIDHDPLSEGTVIQNDYTSYTPRSRSGTMISGPSDISLNLSNDRESRQNVEIIETENIETENIETENIENNSMQDDVEYESVIITPISDHTYQSYSPPSSRQQSRETEDGGRSGEAIF